MAFECICVSLWVISDLASCHVWLVYTSLIEPPWTVLAMNPQQCRPNIMLILNVSVERLCFSLDFVPLVSTTITLYFQLSCCLSLNKSALKFAPGHPFYLFTLIKFNQTMLNSPVGKNWDGNPFCIPFQGLSAITKQVDFIKRKWVIWLTYYQ